LIELSAPSIGGFDYDAPAGVFTRSAPGRRGGAAKYKRFDSAAEAIRYIIEEVPAPLWPGITVETGDETLDHRQILELYDSRGYPFTRNRAQ
jgi:hypothetical protein